ncbi:MAG: precorrin-6y C5,15-methyltransferase (decarboxylating) subunit CbiE [Peptococcaceae bacterium]|nr:MAG: precorrin-6y C5,15-methyltransferase (decarboxylating) subunit CbiE [Peptococcaceae bacterium]
MAKIAVVGIGPGNREYLTPAAEEAVAGAQALVGGERSLALFSEPVRETFVIKNNLPEMIDYIKRKKDKKKVAVLASGDPGFFGILAYLRKYFPPSELHVIPGISTMQMACARLAMPWHDAVPVSIHGRDIGELLEFVRRHKKVVVLMDTRVSPSLLAGMLLAAGMDGKKVHLCTDLSYPSEAVRCFTPAELAGLRDDGVRANRVMVITDE